MRLSSSTRLLAGLAITLFSAGSHAQVYPDRPVHLLVGFAPGGAADTVARAMSDAMGRSLGQTVIVDNKPGAGSSLAAAALARAAPDGYTVLLASPSSVSVNPAMNPKLGYKSSDLKPVIKLTSSPLVIAVNPASGIKTLQELATAAKKAPGTLNYATSGIGSAPHLGAALFLQITGAQMVHIPFKGGAPAVQSVVSGDTQVTFATPPSVLSLVQSGRLRGLGVTARERSPLVPDLPGTVEAGFPGYAMDFWYGLFVPEGTPPAVMRKLFEAATVAMRQPVVKEVLAKEGTDVDLSASTEQFANFLANDNPFWAKLVKDADIKQ